MARRLVFGIVTGAWLCAAAAGLWILWQYDNAPGEAAHAPRSWPSASHLARATDTPTLVVLAHPRCSCTSATLGELAEVLARADVQPRTYVVFLNAAAFADGLERTDLWRTASALPHVSVIRDDHGVDATAFGAATSGQTLLYDRRGTLVFSGGITAARAHQGDNAGRRSIVALLNGAASERPATSVFGCPLFAAGN